MLSVIINDQNVTVNDNRSTDSDAFSHFGHRGALFGIWLRNTSVYLQCRPVHQPDYQLQFRGGNDRLYLYTNK